MWFIGGGLYNGQWEKQDEVEKGAKQVCDLSRSLASAWPHGDVWNTDGTTEPVPTRDKGTSLLSPMAVSSWLCAKRQGTGGHWLPGRQAISGLGQFSQGRDSSCLTAFHFHSCYNSVLCSQMWFHIFYHPIWAVKREWKLLLQWLKNIAFLSNLPNYLLGLFFLISIFKNCIEPTNLSWLEELQNT